LPKPRMRLFTWCIPTNASTSSMPALQNPGWLGRSLGLLLKIKAEMGEQLHINKVQNLHHSGI
jgi:hypothetical protein